MKISNIICDSYPFNHYSFSDVFCENELNDLQQIYSGTEINWERRGSGQRWGSTSNVDYTQKTRGIKILDTNRFFANHENRKTHNVIDRIVSYFSRNDTIAHFENESGRKIFGNYLRVEFIADTQATKLKPHRDVSEKIMSMMIYLNTTDEDPNIGTAIYDSDKILIKTVPYSYNTGFYFYPGENTWHGVEPVTIKTVRKAIMINYCTFEAEFKL